MKYVVYLYNVRMLYIIALLLIYTISRGQTTNFSVGADELLKNDMNLLHNKNVGIITNQTGRLADGKLLIDSLINISDVHIRAIFSPEHGFFTSASNGKIVANSKYKSIQIYSLYGKSKKITKNQLKNIDVLIFDIQDIGARFYTYISTLYYSIEAAAENNVNIIVLDRPNPLGGKCVDGPMLKSEYASFVGIAPMPIVHGMTIGELSLYFNDLIFQKIKKRTNLEVIKMNNWNRERPITYFEHKWINPSPNIPNYETALIYPGTCFLEGTNISEGRGTQSPFLLIGAPFINSTELIRELNRLNCKFLSMTDTNFSPISIPGMALNPKYENTICYGIKIKITDYRKFEPVKFGIKLLYSLHKLYIKQFKFKNKWIDKLIGTDKVRKMIVEGNNSTQIIAQCQPEIEMFKQIRTKYLLY